MKTVQSEDKNMRKILITGGTGSLGQMLVRHLYATNELIILSRDEAKQAAMARHYPAIKFILGDVSLCNNIDIECTDIIHAAALKHVNRAEQQIDIACRINIKGTINMVALAQRTGANLVVVSSDKACAPHTVYGATKLIVERLAHNAGYPAVRYGNIIGSRGSIIPFFMLKMQQGQQIPVTNIKMTRFFMRLSEAVDLVMFALGNQSPVTFVPTMKSIEIRQLAEQFGIVRVIGESTSEKLHEQLISFDEMRCIDLNETPTPEYFAIDQKQGSFDCLGDVFNSHFRMFNSQTASRWNIAELMDVIIHDHDWVSELELKEKTQ